MAPDPRRPYSGPSRKLIVSIDIGTTFTAASFCILQPTETPKFEEVQRWPKQATPDAKMPSVVFYDEDGVARAFGAETDDDDILVDAESEGWSKAAWWKLHLRPAHLPIIENLDLPPLPKNKSVDDVFGDFLGYVLKQVQAYITTTYGDGETIWTSLFPTMVVVLTTPNGWEGKQQQRMRSAAIAAGLVGPAGGSRVRFVSEAEAAVLFAIDGGAVRDWVVPDANVILCDCGGGTIDITGYKIGSVSPLRLDESAASRCYLAGGVFITQAAKSWLRERLACQAWYNEDLLAAAVTHFDRNAKRRFEGTETHCWIQLDGLGPLNNGDLGIMRGRIKVSNELMKSFFNPSLDKIKQGLEDVWNNGNRLAKKVILVGGLAGSPYIFDELVRWGHIKRLSVSRPDGPTTKAVPNGALAWQVDNTVSARFSKYDYGISIRQPISGFANVDEIDGRTTKIAQDGVPHIHDVWSSIVKKNTKINASQEFTSDYRLTLDTNDSNMWNSVIVYVYRRPDAPPTFLTFPNREMLIPGFEELCIVRADMTDLFNSTPSQTGRGGKQYKRLSFTMCLKLGDTEVAARMRWLKADGTYKYGQATVVYD